MTTEAGTYIAVFGAGIMSGGALSYLFGRLEVRKKRQADEPRTVKISRLTVGDAIFFDNTWMEIKYVRVGSDMTRIRFANEHDCVELLNTSEVKCVRKRVTV